MPLPVSTLRLMRIAEKVRAEIKTDVLEQRHRLDRTPTEALAAFVASALRASNPHAAALDEQEASTRGGEQRSEEGGDTDVDRR